MWVALNFSIRMMMISPRMRCGWLNWRVSRPTGASMPEDEADRRSLAGAWFATWALSSHTCARSSAIRSGKRIWAVIYPYWLSVAGRSGITLGISLVKPFQLLMVAGPHIQVFRWSNQGGNIRSIRTAAGEDGLDVLALQLKTGWTVFVI